MPLVSDEEVEQFVQTQLAVEQQPRVTSFCEAWKQVVLLILERMQGGASWSSQKAMAGRLVDAWHRALWFTLYHDTNYDFPAGDALEVLEGYHHQIKSLASLIRVLVSLVYQDQAELATVRAKIDEIQNYCDEELADIAVAAAAGSVNRTTQNFNDLASCSMELLTYILAPELSAQFVESYDAAIKTIDQLIDLSKTTGPGN